MEQRWRHKIQNWLDLTLLSPLIYNKLCLSLVMWSCRLRCSSCYYGLGHVTIWITENNFFCIIIVLLLVCYHYCYCYYNSCCYSHFCIIIIIICIIAINQPYKHDNKCTEEAKQRKSNVFKWNLRLQKEILDFWKEDTNFQ